MMIDLGKASEMTKFIPGGDPEVDALSEGN